MTGKSHSNQDSSAGQCLSGGCPVTPSSLLTSAGNVSHTIPSLSPYRLLPLMIVSIFVSEIIIMFILGWLPKLPMVTEAIADATMLLLILSPTFFFFHYRPLLTHHRERKKIVDQLIQSEERLNLALDAVNDGLWDWDIKNDSVFFSPRWAEMLGYKVDVIDPHISSWQKLMHSADRERVYNELELNLRGLRDFFECEFRMKTAQQEWTWILARGRIVSRDKDGNPLRAIGTHTDINARKKAEEALLQSEMNIRRLSRQLISNSESEKKRLAQDLHDEFGQLLTAFQLGVEMIMNHQISSREEIEFHCARLMGTIAYMEKDLLRICDTLRPVMLDDIGLVETLRWLIGEVEQTTGISLSLAVSGLKQRLEPEPELVCYRVCQEAINNAIKHASARNIQVELIEGERTVILKIEDDGRGFDLDKATVEPGEHWGIGLLGMHERAAAIKGHVNIKTETGKGTTIELVFPHSMRSRERQCRRSESQ